MFWLISDTHFGHDNIVKYCFRPGYPNRLYDHNNFMRKHWIDLISDKDIILHLGDVFLGGDWHRGLPGEKYLIRGNHDSNRKIEILQELGWGLIPPLLLGNVWFTHRPRDVEEGMINIHGHLHQNNSPSKRHINISVEKTDYKPVWLGDVLGDR